MTATELLEMAEALKIPDVIVTPTQSVFSGIEALCLTCARFRTAGDIYELTIKYSRAESAISEVVNWLVTHIDETWSHLLTFDYTHLLSCANLQRFANAVHAAGAPL
jgi:nuclease HARBI1